MEETFSANCDNAHIGYHDQPVNKDIIHKEIIPGLMPHFGEGLSQVSRFCDVNNIKKAVKPSKQKDEFKIDIFLEFNIFRFPVFPEIAFYLICLYEGACHHSCVHPLQNILNARSPLPGQY